jgi:hypothetical protein
LISEGDSQSTAGATTPNSLSFSKDEPDGTPTHSKRRLQQLEKKRSLSPKPLHGGSATVSAMITSPLTRSQNLSEKRASEEGRSEDGAGGESEGEDHYGDYSLDDFDPVSPTKLSKLQPVLSQEPAPAPISATVTLKEDPAQNSLDEIRQRWMNPSSFFAPAETKVEEVKKNPPPTEVQQKAVEAASGSHEDGNPIDENTEQPPGSQRDDIDGNESPDDEGYSATTPLNLPPSTQDSSFFSPENNTPPPR